MLTSGADVQSLFRDSKIHSIDLVLLVIWDFSVAYFLVFHVRNQLLAIGLFLVCTVPFWTSNIIRMISWIPLLGKEGLINSALSSGPITNRSFLLYSSFAVVVAYVHQLTIFMVVPIFNSMARIDKRVVEAAFDAGASRFDIMRLIICAAFQERHCAWLDLRGLDRHGRFLRDQGDVRRRFGVSGRRFL